MFTRLLQVNLTELFADEYVQRLEQVCKNSSFLFWQTQEFIGLINVRALTLDWFSLHIVTMLTFLLHLRSENKLFLTTKFR